MKISFILLCFLFFISTFSLPQESFSQNVGIGTTIPNVSAQLDITSAAKGLLIPRMTTSAISSISNPAKGLMVYDSLKNQLMVNMGSSAVSDWQTIVANSGWNLTGNSNTSNNFIGTADIQSLQFRINNQFAGEIDSANGGLTFFGYGAGRNTMSGFNVAVGYKSLYSNTFGAYNTANGYNALYNNVGGSSNTANGYQALYYNTTGNYNTAIGYQALYSNTTGGYNTAGSGFTLVSNTTGNNNTAHGFFALYSNTIGNNNSADGEEALNSNTTGNNNTAGGYLALTSNTTGYSNTAHGARALYNNSTGNNNTATGDSALFYNSTGNYNTASGYQALFHNTTGLFNVANGEGALYFNTTGSYNVANGTEALRFNTTGQGNTADGQNALLSNATGSANTAFGYYAGGSSDMNNSTAIGYNTFTDASNKIRLGNADIISIGGQVGWTSFSDGRYKQKIKEDVKGLQFIMQLRPVTYTVDLPALSNYYSKNKKDTLFEQARWKQESINYATTHRQSGFIAQEAEQAAKQTGFDFSGIDKPQTENGLYGLRYGDFVVPLVKAVQEQQQMIKESKQLIEELKDQNAGLKRRVAKLEKMINQ